VLPEEERRKLGRREVPETTAAHCIPYHLEDAPILALASLEGRSEFVHAVIEQVLDRTEHLKPHEVGGST
jgi:hypothetical protein